MRRAPISLALAACFAFGVVETQVSAQSNFVVQASRDVRDAANASLEHLAAGRLLEGLDSLQYLLEDGREGLLVGADFLNAQEGSQVPLPEWIGAAGWARQQIESLSAKDRQGYGERVARGAERVLNRATQARSSSELLKIARRYPATQIAVRALITRGDLAFEAGHGQLAARSWEESRRALDLAVPPDADLSSALAARLAIPLSSTVTDVDTLATTEQLPPRLDSAWTLDLPPAPREGFSDFANLRPVIADGIVWLNTGLRILAVDLFSGVTIWDSGEVQGWDQLSAWARKELVLGVARDTLISTVAVDKTSGILVGALQLPLSDADNNNFGSIQITVSLPERRLFAFDSQSGAPLWDHAPRLGNQLSLLGADTFEERMRIAAPPLIESNLVLVPCYELAGRITMFVAAYDLFTGELVWRTRVVGGQQRVNLFGEHESEFNAAPLTAIDNKLIVLSQLGVLAALDLETGEPLWEASYEQFELPRANGYYAPTRARVWQASAPKVADGIVFATPVDCPNLIAFGLASGAPLWSASALDLRGSGFGTVSGEINGRWGLASPNSRVANNSRGEVDHLIAADGKTIWLGGDHLVAWTNDLDDLSVKGPTRTRFPAIKTPSGLLTNGPISPRPLGEATVGTILVPTDWGVLQVDRETGKAAPLGPFGAEGSQFYSPGSLGVSEGVLLLTDEWRLTGWMHWGTLVENAEARLAKAKLEGALDSDLLALELAQLRLKLATSQDLAPTDAWRELQGVRALLSHEDGSDRKFDFTGLRLSDPLQALLLAKLGETRLHLLESEAAWQGAFGDIAEARALIERAVLRAPDPRVVCRLLHALMSYLEISTAPPLQVRQARLETLAELIKTCPREVTPTEYSAVMLDRDLGDFLSAVSALAGPYARAGLPVGLTAHLAIAAIYARSEEHEGQLTHLHEALWEYGLIPVTDDIAIGDLVANQIQVAIDLAPPGAYSNFEAAARAQIEVARLVDAPERRSSVFSGVARRWPHSEAARDARTHLLDIEIEQFSRGITSFEKLAKRVSEVLSDDPDQALNQRALLALGWASNEAGNPHLAHTILKEVATRTPQATATFANGETASQLLVNLRRPIAEQPADSLTTLAPPLSGSASIGGVRIGPFDPVELINALLPKGQVARDGAATKRILLSGAGDELYAFEAAQDVSLEQAATNSILWIFPVGTRAGAPWSRLLCALPHEAPEVIAAVTNGGVVGIAPLTGELLWSIDKSGARAVEISGDGGLLVIQWLSSDGKLWVQGVEAIGGASLWQTEIPSDLLDEFAGAKILVSGASVALLSRENDSSGVLLDGIRGGILNELSFVGQASIRDRSAAWARANTLFLPHFFAGTDGRPNSIDAIDMATGELSYTIQFGNTLELVGIAHFAERSCLWLLPTSEGGTLHAKAKLIEFDTDLGATRDLADLSPTDRIVGLPIGETLTLDGPLLLVASKPTVSPSSAHQGPMTLRAFGIPRGHLWTLNISPPDVLGQGLYDGDLPPMVLARDTIAMTYAITKSGQDSGRSTRLLLIDRHDGRVLDDRALTARLGRIEGLSLRGIGSDLFLFGRGIGSGRGRLEVLGGSR